MKINAAQGVTFPTGDPDGIKKVIIGALLNFCWFLLLIPNLISAGYYLEAMRQASEGEDRVMPDWGNWGNYLARGFWACVISLVYMAVPIVLGIMGFVGAVGGIIGGARHSGVAAAGGASLGVMMMTAAGVIMVIISIFLPMAMLRYARSGQFGDAFNFGGLLADIMKAPFDYFLCWLVPFVINLIGASVLGLTGLGSLLIPALTFYVVMVNAHLLGQYYRAHLADL